VIAHSVTVKRTKAAAPPNFGVSAEARSRVMNHVERCVAPGDIFLDCMSCFRIQEIHPAHRLIGALLETIPEAEQARCPRAELVIPHSGGSGNPPGWHYDRPARSSLPGVTDGHTSRSHEARARS
jgi:hypothetical protein